MPQPQPEDRGKPKPREVVEIRGRPTPEEIEAHVRAGKKVRVLEKREGGIEVEKIYEPL